MKNLTFLLMTGAILLAAAWRGGISGRSQPAPVSAQVAGQTNILLEDFSNGQNPPQLNNFYFNHHFTLGTAWAVSGSGLGEPLSQTPPYALVLYSGNEDRVTFNQASSTSVVTEAQVWGWTETAKNGLPAGRGRVVFEGTGDSKTFAFVGGAAQWQLYKASENDTGDSGKRLGPIVAVRLANLAPIGESGRVLFDDLRVVSATPPTSSNLALSVNGPASPLAIGSTVSYTFTVTNAGPNTAPAVTIEDVLPFGGTFVPGGSASGCQPVLGRVRCSLGTLSVGSSLTVTVRMSVSSAACASFTNRATVTAAAFDSNMGNNTAVHTATTANPACADFAVRQTALPLPPIPGEGMITYALTVLNLGPDLAGSGLNFTLPTHVSFSSVTADSGITCNETGGVVSCTLQPLAGGQQKQIIVTGAADAAMSGMQTSRAEIVPSVADLVPANNVSLFRFTAEPSYEYTLIGELGVDQLSPYTSVGNVVLNNNGQVAFTAVTNPSGSGIPSDFAIYRGDGSGPLTRITQMSDYPALPADYFRRLDGAVDMNDAGTVVFVESVEQSLSATSSRIMEVNIYTGDGGPLTAVNTDVRVGGAFPLFRRAATINNAGRVVAGYHYGNDTTGVDAFENGQEIALMTELTQHNTIYTGQSDNNNYVAYFQSPVWGGSTQPPYTYVLGLISPNGSRQTLMEYPDSYIGLSPVGNVVSVSDAGRVIYASRTPIPAPSTYIEQLKIDNQVLMSELAFFSQNKFMTPQLNNHHRYVFLTDFTSQFGIKGLFTGPHPVGNRVVRANVLRGDILFGQLVVDVYRNFDINDSGQVAFIAGLSNNHYVIVRADPVVEQDQDGVNDWTELGAANQGDGNYDGIPDSAQPHVASTTVLSGTIPVTFAVNPNYTLHNVTSIANPSPDNAPNDPFPLGFFSFEVRDFSPGDAVDVTVYLTNPPFRWWKYGPTPDNPTPHWYEFSYDGVTGAEISGNVVTLHFVDGQRGDSDLTANGIIVDPGGASGFPFATFLPTVLR
jgi:uncharacterized repeat protein (TIGR01451 family)